MAFDGFKDKEFWHTPSCSNKEVFIERYMCVGLFTITWISFKDYKENRINACNEYYTLLIITEVRGFANFTGLLINYKWSFI